MPSEVARLVLGYLKQVGCPRAHDEFLKESRHLSEYRSGLEEGFEYPTSINGKNLMQFINCLSHSSTSSQEKEELRAKNNANQVKIEELNRKIDLLMGQIAQQNISHVVSERPHQQQFQVQLVQQSTSCNATQVQSHAIDSFKTPVKQPRRVHRNQGYACVTPNKTSSGSSGNTDIQHKRTGTPRKSCTPRKLDIQSESTQVLTPSKHVSSDSLSNTLTPSKLNANDFHIQPQVVVGEFMNNPVIPELLADEINKIWNGYSNDSSFQIPNLVNGFMPDITQNPNTLPVETAGQQIGLDNQTQLQQHVPVIEKHHITDKVVNSILTELDTNPTISQFLNDFALKCVEDEALPGTSSQDSELDYDETLIEESSPFSSYISTPVGSYTTTDTENTPSKNSPKSLTTPKSVYREPAVSTSTPQLPIKNLISELKTPEKRPIYNSSPFISPRNQKHSPFQEPTSAHSPLKIVTPDFNSLVASPVRTMTMNQFHTLSVPPSIFAMQPTTYVTPFTNMAATTPTIIQVAKPLHVITTKNTTRNVSSHHSHYRPIMPSLPIKSTKKERIIVPKSNLMKEIKRSSSSTSGFNQWKRQAVEQVKRTVMPSGNTAKKRSLDQQEEGEPVDKRIREIVPTNDPSNNKSEAENQGKLVIDESPLSQVKRNSSSVSSHNNNRKTLYSSSGPSPTALDKDKEEQTLKTTCIVTQRGSNSNISTAKRSADNKASSCLSGVNKNSSLNRMDKEDGRRRSNETASSISCQNKEKQSHDEHDNQDDRRSKNSNREGHYPSVGGGEGLKKKMSADVDTYLGDGETKKLIMGLNLKKMDEVLTKVHGSSSSSIKRKTCSPKKIAGQDGRRDK